MEWQEQLKKYLQDIGLNEEGEFSVYYELLVNNFGKNLKASDIAEKVGMNRSYVYNVLSNLVEKELVTIVLDSSPKSYLAQNPINFVDKQLTDFTNRIEALKKFRKFIKIEIEPELDKIKHLTTSPVKETFLLNSTVKLADYVNQSLKDCEKRIIMRISSEFIDLIKEELTKSIKRLLKEGKKDSIRIICSLRDDNLLNFPYPNLIALHKTPADEYQIIIDDNFYSFNFHLNPFTRPYGVGLMVKEQKVAESYSYSLISSFKQIIYENLPLATENDLSITIKNDKPFANSLISLFSKGWRISPADSDSERNYYALISPESTSFQETRDTGIQYEPFDDTDQNTLINKIFNEAKVFSNQGASEGKFRFDIDYNITTKEDSIEGFTCKILEYQSIINTNSPYGKIAMNTKKTDKKSSVKTNKNVLSTKNNDVIPVTSRMIVFNYCDRAAVMVWALYDENLITIMREIRKFMI